MKIPADQHTKADSLQQLTPCLHDDPEDDFFIAGITPPIPQYPMYAGRASSHPTVDTIRSPTSDQISTDTISRQRNPLTVTSETVLPVAADRGTEIQQRSVSFGKVEVKIFDSMLAADGSVPDDTPPTAEDHAIGRLGGGIVTGAAHFLRELWQVLRQPVDPNARDAALGDLSDLQDMDDAEPPTEDL
jgi:hypothetical protein